MLPLRVREDLCVTTLPAGTTMNQMLPYTRRIVPSRSLFACKAALRWQERTLVGGGHRQSFLSLGAAGPAGTDRIPGPQ